MTDQAQAPRLRSRITVDLTKADAACSRCAGTGRIGQRTLQVEGQDLVVDVICRCVTANGGVAKDKLDEILETIQRDLESGAFGENLARDLRAMPAAQRDLAVARLRERCAHDDLPPVVAAELQRALHLLRALDGGLHGISAPAQC